VPSDAEMAALFNSSFGIALTPTEIAELNTDCPQTVKTLRWSIAA
jgi:hypothetical protein